MILSLLVWILCMTLNARLNAELLPTPYTPLEKMVQSTLIGLGPLGSIGLLLAVPFL